MYYAVESKNSRRLIEIFAEGNKVGEFHRNYDSFGVSTLYSLSYVALSVMELPSCRYLGGEDERDSAGFCPTEVFVPRYQIDEYNGRYEREYREEYWEAGVETHFENDFAFVSGCKWGDDGEGWKVEIRDISKANEGIINRVNDWDRYTLPANAGLKESINIFAFDAKDVSAKPTLNITMAIQKIVRVDLSNNFKLTEF